MKFFGLLKQGDKRDAKLTAKLEIEIGSKLFLKPESCLENAPELELVTILESVADDGHFVIGAPLYKNAIYPLSIGETLFVHFIDPNKKDKGRADFQSVVAERFKNDGLGYIKAKAITDIIFTQRRDYFRIETLLTGVLLYQKEIDGKTEKLQCKCECSDISGGGVAFRSNDTELSVGDVIILSLPIGPEGQLESFLADIRWRIDCDGGVYKLYAGVQFRFSDKQQQDMVMKYVYQLQQELIRRKRNKA